MIKFQFVNSFLSLFYIAFYLQDMEKLKEQLAALLITRQVVGNIKESLIPFLTETFKLAHLNADQTLLTPNSETSQKAHDSDKESDPASSTSSSPKHESADGPSHNRLTQAEVESAMYKYEGTFEDYLEMFIQFGYVILFSSAFPMAAFCALLNNVIEIRSDAFKLCMIFQRPFGQRAENIGTWQDAMEVMGIIAVFVNCALIGMSGQVQRMFPNLSASGTIILIVVLEHIILSIKFGIAYAIPDVPHWVATKLAKVEFQRREAAKHFHTNSLSKKRKIDLRDERRNSEFHCTKMLKQESPKVMNSSSQTELQAMTTCFSSATDIDINKPMIERKPSQIQIDQSVQTEISPESNSSHTGTGHIGPSCTSTHQSNEYLEKVIKPDMDAMSINFETPYASNRKKFQRKLSLPQIKLLRKNSSQESDSPPDSASTSSGNKKGSSGGSAFKIFPNLTLKRKKHKLTRALSFQNPSPDGDSTKASPEVPKPT